MLVPITQLALKELGYFGSADDIKQMKHKNGSNMIIIHVYSCLTPPFNLHHMKITSSKQKGF